MPFQIELFRSLFTHTKKEILPLGPEVVWGIDMLTIWMCVSPITNGHEEHVPYTLD